jgi:hypothetical protein
LTRNQGVPILRKPYRMAALAEAVNALAARRALAGVFTDTLSNGYNLRIISTISAYKSGVCVRIQCINRPWDD